MRSGADSACGNAWLVLGDSAAAPVVPVVPVGVSAAAVTRAMGAVPLSLLTMKLVETE